MRGKVDPMEDGFSEVCGRCGNPIPPDRPGVTYVTDYNGKVLYDGEPICEECSNDMIVHQSADC